VNLRVGSPHHVDGDERAHGSHLLPRAWIRRDVLPSMAMTSGTLSRDVPIQLAKRVLDCVEPVDHVVECVVGRQVKLVGRAAPRKSSRCSPYSRISTKSTWTSP
jgi:hypothetical protein